MVLLTMTTTIVAGLERAQQLRQKKGTAKASNASQEASDTEGSDEKAATGTETPTLESPEPGKPISHGQVLDLWRDLKASGEAELSLEQLLRGSHVYVAPPPPKPEPVSPDSSPSSSRIVTERKPLTLDHRRLSSKPSWLDYVAKKRSAPTNAW
jgi:hypothetical protein